MDSTKEILEENIVASVLNSFCPLKGLVIKEVENEQEIYWVTNLRTQHMNKRVMFVDLFIIMLNSMLVFLVSHHCMQGTLLWKLSSQAVNILDSTACTAAQTD